jgi:hypothetical protein
MSKAARLRRKRAKARKAKIGARRRSRQHRQSKIEAWTKAVWYGFRTTWGAIVAIIVLLAGGAQIYFSTWRMSVTPGETLKTSDPFTTMFVLHNEGQFAMYDVTFGCLLNDVVYPNRTRAMENYVTDEPYNVSMLEANARTSTPCYLPLLPTPPLSVELTVIVSYRPSFFPFHRTSQFRFLARPNDRGGFSWTPMGKK